MRKRPNGRASYTACNVRTPIAMGVFRRWEQHIKLTNLIYKLYGLQSNKRKGIRISI